MNWIAKAGKDAILDLKKSKGTPRILTISNVNSCTPHERSMFHDPPCERHLVWYHMAVMSQLC